MVASGASGVTGGDIGADAMPDIDARSWGDFADQGKGDRSMLDTWTFAERSAADVVAVDDFGGPGDRNDSTNNNGTGGQDPEPEVVIEGLATGGYYKGGCSTVSGSAGSAGLVALLAGLATFGLRRRED